MLPSDPWGYIAGLYEGRGWVTTQRRKGRPTEYVNLGIAMQDAEPLLAIQGRIGGGRVNGPYNRSGGGLVAKGDYNMRYVFMLTKREDIDRVLQQIYRHLSPRRREALVIAMAKDTRGPWSEPA
jgi:hypothetical protein